MARSNGRLTSGDDWKSRMHQIELTPKEEKACVEFYLKNKISLPDLLAKLVELGWKLSVSYSDFYGVVYASATCNREDAPHHKHTFTVRHSETIPAILILYWALADREEKGTLLNPPPKEGGEYLDIAF